MYGFAKVGVCNGGGDGGWCRYIFMLTTVVPRAHRICFARLPLFRFSLFFSSFLTCLFSSHTNFRTRRHTPHLVCFFRIVPSYCCCCCCSLGSLSRRYSCARPRSRRRSPSRWARPESSPPSSGRSWTSSPFGWGCLSTPPSSCSRPPSVRGWVL